MRLRRSVLSLYFIAELAIIFVTLRYRQGGSLQPGPISPSKMLVMGWWGPTNDAGVPGLRARHHVLGSHRPELGERVLHPLAGARSRARSRGVVAMR